MQGLSGTIITKSGDKFNGIFSTPNVDPNNTSFLLKMVQRVTQLEPRADALSDVTSPFVGTAPDYSMRFKLDEIADILVNSVSTSEVVVKENHGKPCTAALAAAIHTDNFPVDSLSNRISY